MSTEKKMWAVYDEQLRGFKAQMAYDTEEDALEMAANRAYHLSQSDEEPIPEDWTTQEICENYGYTAKSVSLKAAEFINNSDKIGLLTVIQIDHIENDELEISSEQEL